MGARKACQADILSTICKACKTFIGDTHTLVQPIGAGMAEATVKHVPAMQAGTTC
jgi:hypothetical protein